jgi:hypothetical protein
MDFSNELDDGVVRGYEAKKRPTGGSACEERWQATLFGDACKPASNGSGHLDQFALGITATVATATN